MAAPNAPQGPAPQGVISARPGTAPPLAQPPSTLDTARAAVGQPGAAPTFASQVAAARGGAPAALPAAPAGFSPAPPAAPAQPGVVPIASHPGFRLYSHEEAAAEAARAAVPTAPQPGAYAPPLTPAGPPPVDPVMLALLTGTQQTNERLAVAFEKIGQPPAQAAGPPDPGPMPNAMLEPEKFQAWLTARDARQMHAIEQRMRAGQPDPAEQQAAQAARAEFDGVTRPLFNELFSTYPGLQHADAAALSGVVNAVAAEVGINSLQALRYVASQPHARADMYARIARRLGVAPGAPPAAPAPAPTAFAQPGQYAGGFMQPHMASAPAPAAPAYVDRTFGVSAGSMMPPAAPAEAAPAQIPNLGAQIAEMQQRAGIYGR